MGCCKDKKENVDLPIETININDVISKLLTNYVSILFEEKLAKKFELLCCVDTEGYFIYACQNHSHILGYESDEFCEIRSFDIIHPSDLQEIRKNFMNLMEEDQPIELVYRIKHKHGHWVKIQSICTPYLSKGKVVALINFSNRFTERQTYEKKSTCVI